jgi:hypothetical protein
MSKEATTILDRIEISSPCSADWDEMLGNEKVRFCPHCSKHVNNLSEMTRKQALELAARSRGRLCVRFSRRAGEPVETEGASHNQLYQIRRRASRLAAGAFTTLFGLASAVAAQTPTPDEQPSATILQQADTTDSAPAAEPAQDEQPGTGVEGETNTNRTILMGEMIVRMADDPLVRAASQNDLPAVRQLIAAGVDVNVRDETTGATALDEAVGHGNREMVRALLDAGAEINARSSRAQTALMRLDDEATENLVWDLVAAGAKLNLRDEDGETVLILAASYSKPEVLRALLAAGAKVNAKDKEGVTALMSAAAAGSLENVRLLIDAGANVNARNNSDETALELAGENEYAEVVELLEVYTAGR